MTRKRRGSKNTNVICCLISMMNKNIQMNFPVIFCECLKIHFIFILDIVNHLKIKTYLIPLWKKLLRGYFICSPTPNKKPKILISKNNLNTVSNYHFQNILISMTRFKISTVIENCINALKQQQQNPNLYLNWLFTC